MMNGKDFQIFQKRRLDELDEASKNNKSITYDSSVFQIISFSTSYSLEFQ